MNDKKEKTMHFFSRFHPDHSACGLQWDLTKVTKELAKVTCLQCMHTLEFRALDRRATHLGFDALTSSMVRNIDASGIGQGCWLWKKALNHHGYGRTSLDGVLWMAHRAVYFLIKGSIRRDLQIDHLCRVRRCVNPDHMEQVTMLENIARGYAGEHHRLKDECPHGHPYSGDNLYLSPRGMRECRACRADAHLKRAGMLAS